MPGFFIFMKAFIESDYRVVRGSPVTDANFGVFHIHTVHSDGKGTGVQFAKQASLIGIQTIVFLDHNNGRAYKDAAAVGGGIEPSVRVIPGREVNSLDGHIGSVGTEEEIPIDLPAEETNRIINESGGKAVALHLGDKATDSISLETVRRVNSNPDPMTHFSFVEGNNAATLKVEKVVALPVFGLIARLSPRGRKVDFASRKAKEFMDEEGVSYNIEQLDGSDAHYWKDFADVVTGYPAGEDFLEAALAGRTWTLVKKRMHYPTPREFQMQKKLLEIRKVNPPVV